MDNWKNPVILGKMISNFKVFYTIDGSLPFWENKNVGLAFHRAKPGKCFVKCCKKNGIGNIKFKKHYKRQDQHGKKTNDNIPGGYFKLPNVSTGTLFAFSFITVCLEP